MRYTIKPGHCIERDGKPFLRLSHLTEDGTNVSDTLTTQYICTMLNAAEQITEATKGHLKA